MVHPCSPRKSSRTSRIHLHLLALLLLGLVLVPSTRAASFENTGDLSTGRYDHTATLLLDGKVLVVGGIDYPADATTTAELYDPTTASWAYTATARSIRYLHTATLLPDGRVLVAGGETGLLDYTDTAEIYDPASETWTETGKMNNYGRLGHTATLLADGKVLVCGGFVLSPYSLLPLATAELYDPATGVWTKIAKMTTARGGATATLLPNGKVLLAGGRDLDDQLLATAELYDPGTGTWTVTGSMAAARQFHSATLLPDGMVLVAGGDDADGASCELYNPQDGTWSASGSLNIGRSRHTATLLPDGAVLVAGGRNTKTQSPLASAELYRPESGTWTTTGSLNTGRTDHTATLLPDNTVLIAGGYQIVFKALASAELFVRPPALLNISTRMAVGTGDNALIGGFIITGSGPQTVIVRGLGPSLALSGTLADPMIELHDSSGALIASNDNWKDDVNQQKVVDNHLAPSSAAESALWQTLEPGAYTVILKGSNSGTGIGLVEVYALGSDAELANISSRGVVQTDDNALIGGIIVGPGAGIDSANIYLRALGPSVPVPNALRDPTLELHDGNGTLIDSNDNWKTRPDGSSQQADIEATTIPPTDDSESALLETLSPGNYTAIVREKNDLTGVGLVEIYKLP